MNSVPYDFCFVNTPEMRVKYLKIALTKVGREMHLCYQGFLRFQAFLKAFGLLSKCFLLNTPQLRHLKA